MRGKIALEALQIINGQRTQQHGQPEESFTAIADLWNNYLEFEKVIDGHDVAIAQALVKLARIKTGCDDVDSYRDAIGYIALAADMAGVADDINENEIFEKLFVPEGVA